MRSIALAIAAALVLSPFVTDARADWPLSRAHAASGLAHPGPISPRPVPATAKAQPSSATKVQRGREIDYGRTVDLAALFSALTLTYLCCHPVVAFVRRGWSVKKADIFSSLSSAAKERYLKTFNIEGAEDPTKTFSKMYMFRYGRYRLLAPAILLVLVALPLLYLEASSGVAALIRESSGGSSALATLADSDMPIVTLPGIAQAAFAGAFVWVVASLVDGATRYNLPPKAVLGAALRLAVSVPLGYAIQSITQPAIAGFIAFAVGAFPLDAVQTLLKRLATNKLGLEGGAETLKDRTTVLDGVDQSTADRLEDGDVITVSQLAYCDPVQLSMRTNLAFTSIIDAQSQALARIYLGEDLPQLFGIGLRGAIEIKTFMDELQAEATPGSAHALLQIASARTGAASQQPPRPVIEPDGLRHAFGEIAGDPYTLFLCAVWDSTGEDVST